MRYSRQSPRRLSSTQHQKSACPPHTVYGSPQRTPGRSIATVSRRMSIPRLCRRSSPLRGVTGIRKCIMAARRMIRGLYGNPWQDRTGAFPDTRSHPCPPPGPNPVSFDRASIRRFKRPPANEGGVAPSRPLGLHLVRDRTGRLGFDDFWDDFKSGAVRCGRFALYGAVRRIACARSRGAQSAVQPQKR